MQHRSSMRRSDVKRIRCIARWEPQEKRPRFIRLPNSGPICLAVRGEDGISLVLAIRDDMYREQWHDRTPLVGGVSLYSAAERHTNETIGGCTSVDLSTPSTRELKVLQLIS